MLAQKDKEIEEINSARQKEMDFVDEMIAKADELGVVAKDEKNGLKVKEEVKEVEVMEK
jgi:5-enolpyruvylshikimate-3-phosphate synthase